MSRQFTVRRGSPADLDELLSLRLEAEEWLRDNGEAHDSSPWATYSRGRIIRRDMTVWETWLVFDGGRAAATATLGGPDADFWNEQDDPYSALYLYKLIVSREYAGLGLGDAILDWACSRAQQDAKMWLRLDVWRDNTKLHEYYRCRGFEHVRTVSPEHRRSGALFQRPAGLVLAGSDVTLREVPAPGG